MTVTGVNMTVYKVDVLKYKDEVEGVEEDLGKAKEGVVSVDILEEVAVNMKMELIYHI